MRPLNGWKAFGAWSVAAWLLVLSYLSGASIGLFLLPVALVVLLLVVMLASPWPEVLGAVAGVGAAFLLIAFLSRDYNPCPESGVLTLEPGETSAECGGSDPTSWLVGGVVFVAISIAAYVWVTRSGTKRPMSA